jgi:hypothetical protein
VIIVKLPFLVKMPPLLIVMTIASYRFQVIVALSMAQFVVSKFTNSQKSKPKIQIVVEKMKVYYVIFITTTYN